MITATVNELDADKEKRLRAWLDRPEFDVLLEVAASLGKKHLVDSTVTALSTKAYPQKVDIANSDLEKAMRYQDFIDVIKDLKQSRDRFRLITLK